MNGLHRARLLAPAAAAVLVIGLMGAPVGTEAATPPAQPVVVTPAAHHDVSPPLRNMRPSAPGAANLRERPLLRTGGPSNGAADGALQTTTGPAVATTAGLGFPGVGQGDYGFTDMYAPPDTNGAVGATQYVQWVNVDFAVFDKTTGALEYGPVAGNTLWSGFGGGCETNNDGDPIVRYDALADRWILTQFSVSTKPYLQCVAISEGSDAMGPYYRYAFSFGTTQFPDYPKLGVWPDAYYMSFNIFNRGRTWAGSKACALDRAAMLAGAAATMQCVQLSTSYPSLLPADLDGTTAPPAGSPGMFLNFGTNTLNFWRFHVDWANSANSALTGPTSIPVASFSPACNGGTCIPQPGTTQKLDSLADRLMYRLAYRNFGDHESMVVNHSVTAATGSSGIRWYELRNATGSTMAAATPVVHQQGTYAPDSNYRWMGSIAMDQAGDIAVGYSVSSGSLYPSIAYTGRVPTDALGTMEAETTVKTGSGSQLATLSRWGDYSAMSVDPVDGCTFWYTNEYLKTSGTFNWSTWITSFKFPGCSASSPTAPTAPQNLAATAGDASVSLAWQAPSSDGGSAVTYAVYRSTVSGDELKGAAIATGLTSTSYTDGGLTNGTTYYYEVVATNAVGSSAPSNEASATPSASTATAPTAPQNLAATAGDASVSLTWQAPSSDGGSPITGYEVYRGTSSGSETPLTTLGVTTTYTDTTAANGTTYYYEVLAKNSIGTSLPSNEASATPSASSATVPTAPQSLTAAPANGRGVQLAWQAPSSDGGSPIAGYYVYRGTTTGGEGATPIATVTSGTSYKDTATTRGTTYYYTVAAYNSIGPGPMSNEASATAK